MSAVLPAAVAPSNRLREWPDRVEEQVNEWPARTRESEPQQAQWQSLSILGGCGLLLCGVLRGSWSGLALAAVGGWLVYRGLSQSHLQAPPRESPPAAEPPPVSQDLPETNAEQPLFSESLPESVAIEEEPAASAPAVEVAEVVVLEYRELLPEELPLAQTTAYFLALERGGGSLPHYDHGRAIDDFLRAAAQIILSSGRP